MHRSDYTIVTVATHIPQQEYYCFAEFLKSVDEDNLLILDREFTNYSGLTSKPNGLHKAITQGQIKTEYVLFVDCFDLVFTVPAKTLMDQYKRDYEGKVLFSCERNCFPANLKDEYDKLPYRSSYRYLNSGMIIGKTRDLLTMLEALGAPNLEGDHYDKELQQQINPNDQELYQHLFLKQPVPMELDYEQAFCNCLHSNTIDDLIFLPNGLIKNKETGSFIMSAHFNGDAKSSGLREPVLKHLNLL